MVYLSASGSKRNGPPGPDALARARGGPQGEAHSPAPAKPTGEDPNELELQRELTLAFAPIHKRAFGVAVGVTLALFVALLTIFHVLLNPEREAYLRLLSHYFYGYSVSWPGVFIGAFWGFIVGFVGGWFVAFCRNLAVAVSIFVTRTRAELRETRDFLDHI
jgi:hypothetical protein